MKTILIIASLLASSFAWAQEGQSTDSMERYILPEGWGEYFAASTGVMQDIDSATPTAGQPNSLKILGSRQLGESRWLGDAGIGWQFHTLNDTDQVDYDVINSFLIELAARYDLENRWQLGGIFNTLIPGEPERYGTDDNFVLFLGPSLMREFNYADTDMRFGVSWMRDLNINDEEIDVIGAHFHFRFGGDAAIASRGAGERTTAQR